MVNHLSVPLFLAAPVLAGAARRAGGAWREGGGWRSGADLDGKVAGSVDQMERDLLSRVTGDGVRQRLEEGQDRRPPPSPTLGFRLGSAEERQSLTDATIRAHGHAPQRAQSPAPGANMVSPLPTSSRVPFASDRLASVVVPGYPMAERRHNLRAGAGWTCAQSASPAGSAPHAQRAPTAPVPVLQRAGPTAATGTGQERCDACGLSAQLLRELASDLDRARAQVALLTCQNESLRSRLKRAAAAAAAAEPAPAASSAHLDLRCGACRVRPATVALVPREHLCLCGRCFDAAVACPVCHAAVGTGPAEAPPVSSWPSKFLKRS